MAAFRAYPDLRSAFSDYVQFLKGNPRYTEALANGVARREIRRFPADRRATPPTPATPASYVQSSSSPRFNELIGSFKNSLRAADL